MAHDSVQSHGQKVASISGCSLECQYCNRTTLGWFADKTTCEHDTCRRRKLVCSGYQPCSQSDQLLGPITRLVVVALSPLVWILQEAGRSGLVDPVDPKFSIKLDYDLLRGVYI